MTIKDNQTIKPIIIGAGPAGLTAAYHLGKHGIRSDVLEADSVVGGISPVSYTHLTLPTILLV